MNLHNKYLLMTDDNYKRIVEMAMRSHIVEMILNPQADAEQKAMAVRIFYGLSGYSIDSVSSIACEVIASAVEIAFPNKDRQTILDELLSGGEAETQLKTAIAANFLAWEKPSSSNA
jgi:hypothetical protein